MSRFSRGNEASTPKYYTLEGLKFSLFTKEQLKKMAVIKITTPLTLDNFGHPLPGGLYDTSLGPLRDMSEPCKTCGKMYYACPGHFGYIEFPLPVVNPIFHRIIGMILRMSCLHCFFIQIPGHIKCSISLQLKLLNRGLITHALEIENHINELISNYGDLENIPEEAVNPLREYEKLANDIETNEKFLLNKTTESLRNQFVNGLLKQIKPRRICVFCKSLMDRTQVIRNKIILTRKKMATTRSPSSGNIKGTEAKYVTPEESRQYMRNIWENEKNLLKEIIGVLDSVKDKYPTDAFYFDVIPVVPTNVRPVNVIGDRVTEHVQTEIYKQILKNSIMLRMIIQVVKNGGDLSCLPVEAKQAYSFAQGKTAVEKLNNAWEALQYTVDGLVDQSGGRAKDGHGLKQIIEKKAGIIRMHMMGKRVNFAARSVITPDPNLNIEEIGVPEAFAKHLTYPVPVTTWNVEELRKMILNGPNVHPGATMIEYEDGTIVRLNTKNPVQQKSILKRLLTPDDKERGFKGVKKVHRHLCNGDILLLNRQPTLHKPSIMGHTARILKGEKTLRLHYANCKAYNADFDGDEMNAHFPQNELARSEGYNLANVSNQYLVPKDGTPLSGLIQDHMISGVRLSLRGRFFNKSDYQQLVFQALSHKNTKIILLPPSILKPEVLWSGKQILSTVIINVIPEGRPLINLNASSKISPKSWETGLAKPWQFGGTPLDELNMSEAEVVIRNGELLCGVLDKTHYGSTPYGLIHCIYELYSGTYAVRLLSSLAKLFTRFLQQEGFTLGVRDILTVKQADQKRQKIIRKARKIGHGVIRNTLDLPEDTAIEEITKKIEAGCQDGKFRANIDRGYKTALDSYTNAINKACLPAGLVCKFPENNLQLMVLSGAKGSTVNTMQISCLLGQIELEGKRPPVMICGKSLPSFPIFEFSPRAGGFIDGRFMTGIQPQEFFFHCMAGREGLIDTAVKTSRSGYLQRCLIKHLEGLTVNYDMTVRDSDKSVIQFLYGEDGMDISKVQFLNDKNVKILAENSKVILDKNVLKQLKHDEEQASVKEYKQKLSDWREKFGEPLKTKIPREFPLFSNLVKQRRPDATSQLIRHLWREAGDDIKSELKARCVHCPDPINSVFQADHHFGSINERLYDLISKNKDKKKFEDMINLRAIEAVCAPGEPVGLLAAQSVGEPSTQMTLNTFHFAGRGEMNVTLGIPRLREILMMASKNIKTPSMEIPFLKDVEDLESKSQQLRRVLTRVTVADVLEKIDVEVALTLHPKRQYSYKLRFYFLPKYCYQNDYHTKPKKIVKHMSKKFFAEMFNAVKRITKTTTTLVVMEKEKRAKANRGDDEDGPNEDENSSEEEVEDEEDAKMTNKYEQTHDDQEPEEEEVEKSDNEDEENADEADKVDENAEGKKDNEVIEQYSFAQNYVYDHKKYLWCELTFAMPLNFKKLDLNAILKNVAAKSIIWETENIKRAITYQKDDMLFLRTDGINILEMFKYDNLLDLNKLFVNDIHKMAETYGIEAAMKIIVKEVQDVFNVYGIKVDPRHLLLIADYMTYNGSFEPLSRKGMESSASPLQQMSFESSLTFLRNATIGGKRDDLRSPSSCLMVGKPCYSGTGLFRLCQKIPNYV